MSVKHVRSYYEQVTNDYVELKRILDTLEKEATEETATNVLENIETIKKQTEKLKDNYDRISYIIYLLNLPNRKKKQKRYIQEQKKVLDKIPESATLEKIKEENKNSINIINEIKDAKI